MPSVSPTIFRLIGSEAIWKRGTAEHTLPPKRQLDFFNGRCSGTHGGNSGLRDDIEAVNWTWGPIIYAKAMSLQIVGVGTLALRPVKIAIVVGDLVVTVPEGTRERIARAHAKGAERRSPS